MLAAEPASNCASETGSVPCAVVTTTAHEHDITYINYSLPERRQVHPPVSYSIDFPVLDHPLMNIDSITRTFGATSILTLIINLLSIIGVTVGVVAALSSTDAGAHALSSHSDITVPADTEKTETETTPEETDTNPDPETKQKPAESAPGSSDLSSDSDKTEADNTPPITVEQGMRIYTPFGQRTDAEGKTRNVLKGCTLSYIDHAHKLGYTSAHCLGAVDNGTYTGGSVTVSNEDEQPIGQAWPNTNYVAGKDYNPYDIAVIRFDDNVILGENSYSGNAVVTATDIVESDTFCTYGATSLKVRCGDDTSTYGLYRSPGEFHVVGAGTKPGDSGSPVWVRDENGNTKGYLGVLSGHLHNSGPNAIGTPFETLNRAEFDAQAFAGV